MTLQVKLTREVNATHHGVAINAVIPIDIEDYLKGVVPAEIYEGRTPAEAKKALAIAARTYALYKAQSGTTLVDTPLHQSYNASKIAQSPKSAAAVEATRGQVLTYAGKVIQCYYSNSNGGETKRTDQVWSAKLPYYQNVPDPWDTAAREGKTIAASHGVGLSQIGAEYAAGIGKTCGEILSFYYPNTAIAPNYGEKEATMNTKTTAAQLAAFAIKAYEDGVKYWYGTCYYPCTNALLASKTKQYPTHYAENRQAGYRADIAAGAICCDCIGLIKGAMWSSLGTTATKYGANDCLDKGANGMLAYCKAQKTRWGDMSTYPDTPGLLLHKDGHVGISIGGGYAIEAKSYAEDLVRSAVAGRGWTSWAELPFIAYDGVPLPEVKPIALGDRTLRRGMHGDDVTALQEALVALGYDLGSFGAQKNGVDGDYGYSTEAAVKALQRKAELTVDGVYGKASHAALLLMLQAQPAPDGAQDAEEGAPTEDGAAETPTFTAIIPGLDAETANALKALYEGVILQQSNLSQ
ncbi:MAG: SpoIID/LytB domain-containing protein [Oscillospiraceae bacterium]|jgi:hypothetical protein|nr:SpoIID/LytB domain-containing protein [Oscillospiraceae bacterium]